MTILPIPHQSDVERAFADAMAQDGFHAGHIEADTPEFMRFDAPGDKKSKGNGFYKLVTGRYPVGWYGDWKLGQQIQWQWDFGRELTKDERTKIKAQQRRLKMEAQLSREARQKEVAERASQIWGKASSDVGGHPYLKKKLIEIPRNLRLHTANGGDRLLAVPMYSFGMDGKPVLTNLQLISDNGTKRFLKAGRVEGCFFSLKGDSSLIIICEGTATGFTIWQATGASVVIAFNSGNLIEVAKEFSRHRPLSTLMIAGDDDVVAPDDWKEKGQGRAWVNAGRLKAEAAAKVVGCRWVMPTFKDGPSRDRTDYNDLHALEGLEAVERQVIGAIKGIDAEDTSPGATIHEINVTQDESWRTQLPMTTAGMEDGANVEGVALYIQNHKLLRARLGFNQFDQAVELDQSELADHHISEFRRIMHKDRFKAKKSDVADEMMAEARRNQYDPLADYLQGIKWDGVNRLDTFLIKYFGAEDKPFPRIAGRKFLVGAVARALRAGCKMDTMIVLEGDQGTFKSTGLRYLFGDRFFIDHLPDFHSKDSFQQLQGAWCVEVAELAAMSKAEVSDVKQFLSRLVDKYRPPYGKLPIMVPRRCVFGGTMNPEEGGYLRDTTGARRFWPIRVGRVDLDAILRDRDQLWGEAVAAFKAGEIWYLKEEHEVAMAEEEQLARREVDPWEHSLQKWAFDYTIHETTIENALTNAVGMTKDRQKPVERRRMGAALTALGWKGKVKKVGGVAARVFRNPKYPEDNPPVKTSVQSEMPYETPPPPTQADLEEMANREDPMSEDNWLPPDWD